MWLCTSKLLCSFLLDMVTRKGGTEKKEDECCMKKFVEDKSMYQMKSTRDKSIWIHPFKSKEWQLHLSVKSWNMSWETHSILLHSNISWFSPLNFPPCFHVHYYLASDTSMFHSHYKSSSSTNTLSGKPKTMTLIMPSPLPFISSSPFHLPLLSLQLSSLLSLIPFQFFELNKSFSHRRYLKSNEELHVF